MKILTKPIVVICLCIVASLACNTIANGLSTGKFFNGLGRHYIKPSKELVTRERSISGKYMGIETCRGINVIYKVSDNNSSKAEISAPSNIIDHVVISVTDRKLKVSIDNDIQIDGNANTTITLTGPEIGEYDACSAGHIIVESPLNLPKKLTVDVSSAGRVEFKQPVKSDIVSIDASSAGNIAAVGIECKKGEIDVSSAANIKIDRLTGANYSLDASSAGAITIDDTHVEYIRASASSGSKIIVKGQTDKADLKATSGALLECKNLKVKMDRNMKVDNSSGGRVSTI